MKLREQINWVEMTFAVLLLLSTLSSAFCVYEASQWTGTQNQLYTESIQLKTDSSIAHNDANRRFLVDITLFMDWVDAKSKNDPVRSDFIEQRFPPEFRPAFDAWLASARDTPGTLPPGTPFARTEYHLATLDQSDQLEEKAKAAYEQGNKANALGNQYILITVLFTLVLFLCGVGEEWEAPQIKRLILVVASFMFIIAMAAVLWITINNGL